MIDSAAADNTHTADVRAVVVRGGPTAGRTMPSVYRIAARRLVTDLGLVPLRPFLTANAGPPGTSPPRPVRSGGMRGSEVIYRGPGWVGGGMREVECCAGPSGIQLRIRHIGLTSIADDGGSIEVDELDPGCDDEQLAAAVLGPALVLALARQDVWCLHASAVEMEGRAILFLGRSGAGKSTLAHRLASNGVVSRRLADDVVPVAVAGGTLWCLPHFPQLKLGATEQAGADVPERMPVGAVYCLEEAEDDCGGRAEELTQRSAVGVLVQRTVAARLFDKQLLKRHLGFCAAAAAAVSMQRVAYPLRPDSVAAVSELLMAARSRS